MVKNPIRNIRISDATWKKAKRDALERDMSLQDWVAVCILHCGSGSPVVEKGK